MAYASIGTGTGREQQAGGEPHCCLRLHLVTKTKLAMAHAVTLL